MAAEVTELDPISVEGEPVEETLPDATSVEKETLQRLRPATSDAASLLRGIPGITLNGAGGLSSLPAIHGLANDRLHIEVDGMSLVAACPNHMNPPLSYVDPGHVDSLRVFAGITPVSVGGDSIGGTIIAETVEPEFAEPGMPEKVFGDVASFYRSNNRAFGTSAAAALATERFSIRYSGAWSEADNYTAAEDFKTAVATGRPGHTLPADEVGSTAYTTANHLLNVAWKTGDGVLKMSLASQNMSEQLFPNQRMDLLKNEQHRVAIDWQTGYGWGRLEARAYHEAVDHEMDFGPDKRLWYGALSQPPAAAEPGTPCSPPGFMTCAEGMPMMSEGTTYGAKLLGEFMRAGGDLLRLGAEYHRHRLDDYWPASGGGMWPGTFLNVNDGERDRKALFAEWESRAQSRWLILLGIRYEHVTTDTGEVTGYATANPAPGNQIPEALAFNSRNRQRSDDNVDITALARYTFTDEFDVEFGVARKVRSPNLYERYTWSSWAMAASMNNTAGDGNGYVGDIDLKAETALTFLVSFRWQAADRSWALTATPYYTRVENYIDAIALPGWTPGQFNTLRYANQSVRIFGVDLSANALLASNEWGEWRLGGVAGYTDGENRDSADDLWNIMPLNARITLNHRLGDWDNEIEWVIVNAKTHVSTVRNEVETPGYGLLNLRASHSWKRLRVDVGVENLLDKFYYLPTGGTYTGQGSTMSLSGIPWGTAVPGMGRSWYAGFSMSFE
ncbi:TonB-dependent receptor [Elongatibacter sediminis]|uniref:TonB-dependent receptor n=1 Tax=Elongatibacter sediminis TaxID=3119006 RepID=A0AAW9RJU6_9GAMM